MGISVRRMFPSFVCYEYVLKRETIKFNVDNELKFMIRTLLYFSIFPSIFWIYEQISKKTVQKEIIRMDKK